VTDLLLLIVLSTSKNINLMATWPHGKKKMALKCPLGGVQSNIDYFIID
jgi:hypothetical protein